jgi:hypothetical protein
MSSIRKKTLVFLIFLVVTLFVLFESKLSEDDVQDQLTCGRLPMAKDILTDNLMWQVLETDDGYKVMNSLYVCFLFDLCYFRFLFLLRAYLNTRKEKTVVITTIGPKSILKRRKLFCQYWFEGKSNPFVVKVSRIHEMYKICELTCHFDVNAT